MMQFQFCTDFKSPAEVNLARKRLTEHVTKLGLIEVDRDSYSEVP